MLSPQIMPSATRAFLDSMKTSSYHIKTVIACVQSAKSSSNFKLVVWRDGGNKRYDFEAESPKVAGERLLLSSSDGYFNRHS